MAIRRSFNEAMQKSLSESGKRPRRTGADKGMDENGGYPGKTGTSKRRPDLPGEDAIRLGIPAKTIQKMTGIDAWFINQIKRALWSWKIGCLSLTLPMISPQISSGNSKKRVFWCTNRAWVLRISEDEVTRRRKELGIRRVYKMVDTCALRIWIQNQLFLLLIWW